jgi:hypothetical protein
LFLSFCSYSQNIRPFHHLESRISVE